MLVDVLPVADLCLIRQVLQHHCNADVARVLAGLGAFKYVIVTEDIDAAPGLEANLDSTGGAGLRPGAALMINRAPFGVACTIINDHNFYATRMLRSYLVEPGRNPRLGPAARARGFRCHAKSEILRVLRRWFP